MLWCKKEAHALNPDLGSGKLPRWNDTKVDLKVEEEINTYAKAKEEKVWLSSGDGKNNGWIREGNGRGGVGGMEVPEGDGRLEGQGHRVVLSVICKAHWAAGLSPWGLTGTIDGFYAGSYTLLSQEELTRCFSLPGTNAVTTTWLWPPAYVCTRLNIDLMWNFVFPLILNKIMKNNN